MLTHATFRGSHGDSVHILGHELKYDGVRRQSRYWCPDCFAEQPYHRAAWDVASHTHCVVHRRPLEKACPSCHKPIGWARLDLLHCQCGAGLDQPKCEPVGEEFLLFDRWLLSRLEARPAPPCGLLEKMPLQEAITVCERLGGHSLNPCVPFANTWRREGAAVVLRAGFDIAAAGRKGVLVFLDQLLAHRDDRLASSNKVPTSSGGWGLQGAYGTFADWLKRLAHNPAYGQLTMIAAEHARSNVTLKSGAKLFGFRNDVPVQGVGIKEASRSAGIGHRRLRIIAQELGLLPLKLKQGRPARLSEAAIRDIKAHCCGRVDVNQAAKILGLSNKTTSSLVRAELIPNTIWPHGKGRDPHFIARAAIDELVSRLEALAVERKSEDSLPLPAAVVSANVSIVDAVKWALVSEAPFSGIDKDAIGLRRLLVRPCELASARSRRMKGSLSVNQVAKRLGTKWDVVMQLVKLGYLPATKAAGANWIAEESVTEFEIRFIKGSEVALKLETIPVWVSEKLAPHGIKPVIDHDLCRLIFYTRTDFENLLTKITNH